MAAGDTTTIYSDTNGRAGAVFDGVDDHVAINPYSFTKDFTLSFWIFADRQTTSNIYNFDYWGTAFNQNAIRIKTDDDGAIDFIISENNLNSLVSFTNLPDRTWTHIVFSYDGVTMDIYKNGLPVDDATATDSFVTDTDHIVLGGQRDLNASRFFKGKLSNFKIYDRKVTDAEAVLLAADRPVTNGLTHHYKLDTDYTDSAGSSDGSNAGSYLSIVDDKLAQQVANLRVTANDKWFMSTQDKQLAITHIEEVA